MRLITWNCNMAFRNKLQLILAEKPDILVIPESENPEKFKLKDEVPKPTDSFWFGDNPHKGLGVYTYNGFKIKRIEDHSTDFRYIVPLQITNGSIEFVLFATWCQKPVRGTNYGSHTWNAINHYTELFEQDKVIIAGDLNSNTMWDRPNREANHSNIVKRLQEKGIQSTYHVYHQEAHGKESCATHYLYRKRDRPYHLDFCFASSFFLERLIKAEVGTYERWTTYSDHIPLIVDFIID